MRQIMSKIPCVVPTASKHARLHLVNQQFALRLQISDAQRVGSGVIKAPGLGPNDEGAQLPELGRILKHDVLRSGLRAPQYAHPRKQFRGAAGRLAVQRKMKQVMQPLHGSEGVD